jgi:hypothetical protein
LAYRASDATEVWPLLAVLRIVGQRGVAELVECLAAAVLGEQFLGHPVREACPSAGPVNVAGRELDARAALGEEQRARRPALEVAG